MTRVLLATSLVVPLLLAAGCRRPGGGGGPSDSFDRRAMLSNLAGNVMLPAIQGFETEALELAAATEALNLAVGTTGHAAALTAARVAWGETLDAWQEVEVMQIGPAADAGMSTSGEGLRDEIYSWPTVSHCAVDQEIVDGEYDDPGFFDAALVNVTGLAAAEYLLHHDAPGNSCPSQIDINANGTWNALGVAEVTARRASYADAVADEIAGDAGRLADAWESAGGDFVGGLATAGLDGSPFDSAQDAVNELFAAIFYVELRVKDDKLGAPAGISPDCPTATCPNLLESRLSGRSEQNVVTNLRSFRRLFLGGETAAAGIGFDDFLVELGAADLAAEMEQETDAAIVSVEAIPGATMEASLASDLEDVVAAHTAIKLMTDDLKSTFVTVLNLRVPDEGAGDND